MFVTLHCMLEKLFEYCFYGEGYGTIYLAILSKIWNNEFSTIMENLEIVVPNLAPEMERGGFYEG